MLCRRSKEPAETPWRSFRNTGGANIGKQQKPLYACPMVLPRAQVSSSRFASLLDTLRALQSPEIRRKDGEQAFSAQGKELLYLRSTSRGSKIYNTNRHLPEIIEAIRNDTPA